MATAISFNFENQSFYIELQEGKCVTIGSGQYDHFHVSSFMPSQFTLEMYQSNVYFSSKYPQVIDRYLIPQKGALLLNKQHRMLLYVTQNVGVSQKKARLPFNGVVSVGRSQSNMIVTKLDFMSREHFQLICKDGIVTLKDLNSTSGLFLNGQKVQQAILKPGDIISIFTLRITYRHQELTFENVGESLTINHIPGVEVVKENGEVTVGRVFYRSPRIQSQLPENEITLAPPPNKNQQNPQHRSMFMQMLSTGTMFTTSMLMGMASPAYMAARSLSLIMPIANMFMQRKQDKKINAQLEQYETLRKNLYGKYIEDQKATIQFYADQQRNIIKQENPSPQQCLSMASNLDKNLWERTARDRDFLDIRVGMGYEKLCVEVKASHQNAGFQMDYDEMKQLAREIIEETEYVDDVPARVSLQKFNSVGVIGDRNKAIHLVRKMLVSLSATHFHKDVKIVGVFDETEKDFWEPLKWLPHVFDDSMQSRFMALNYKDAQELFDRLNEQVIKERKEAFEKANGRQKTMALPHYIFVIGSKRYVKNHVIMENLLLNTPEIGISSIFLFNDLYELPAETQFIVDVNGEKGFASAYEPQKINRRFLFELDCPISNSDLDKFTRQLSAITVKGYSKRSDIPNRVTFLEGYHVERVEDLEIAKRWLRKRQDESMPAPIGMMSGNRIFALDTYEDGHGPHGLIAGATGEGKSELVKSWILSMMVNYHPHDVNFVFIDFKGGGMASNFRGAPHVVGEITNLDTGMDRAFEALTSENRRRQDIFQKYNIPNNDIKIYHEQYRRGLVKEIIPHLFIVVDEFKMLKVHSPDTIARMNEIATVGRSLGVHLVLATQSPSEAIDKTIQDNSQYRLSLRLQHASESRELLETADATTLRNKGRCYVKVKKEIYEMFQSFYSGAPYYPNGKPKNQASQQVYEVKMDGTRVHRGTSNHQVKSEISESQAIVDHIIEVTKTLHIKKLDDLWLEELPTELSLMTLSKHRYKDGMWQGKENWLEIPVGMYDSPSTQSQGLATINFSNEGNLAVYGISGSGKTNFLKTMMMSIGLNYSPEDVQIYGIDCGGGSTTIFNAMPHVGGIARDGQTEKIEVLLKMVNDEIERRRKHFLKEAEGIVSLKEYREIIGKDMPAWIFFVDNIAAFSQSYENLYDDLYSIISKGAAYGIYFVMTSIAQTGYRTNIINHIQNRITFELNDKMDYGSIVGKVYGVPLPSQSGRALFKGPLVVQTALFMEGINEVERVKNLKVFLQEMNDHYQGQRPQPIPVLPEVIRMSEMVEIYKDCFQVPIGLTYQDIQPAYVDFKNKNTFLVSGLPQTGKSRWIQNMAGLIHQCYPDSQMYIFDGLKQQLRECAEYATFYSVCSDQMKVTNAFHDIASELNQRKKEKENIDQKPMLCMVIDHLSEFYKHKPDGIIKMLPNIIMKSQGLNVIIIAAVNVQDVAELTKNEEVKYIIENKHGFVFSGTMSQHHFYKTDAISYEAKNTALKEGEAYLVDESQLIKIKPAG